MNELTSEFEYRIIQNIFEQTEQISNNRNSKYSPSIIAVLQLIGRRSCKCGMAECVCIQQSQITAYNELIHADGISDVEVFGYQLADWIIKNNVVEQIFGPNLHVEASISFHNFSLNILYEIHFKLFDIIL